MYVKYRLIADYAMLVNARATGNARTLERLLFVHSISQDLITVPLMGLDSTRAQACYGIALSIVALVASRGSKV